MYIAKTFHGLEQILAQELNQLGATNIQERKRAVQFDGDLELLYKANLHLRTALRILQPIHQFQARSEQQFYQQVQEIDWSEYLDINSTFAIDSVVYSRFFKHSKYIALKTKDAIVDQFRQKTGRRPSIDVERPDLRLNLYINDHRCSLSLDSSGESLHRRGYRTQKNLAPLNEVLAAGMILMTGWQGETPFIDPMCGSGTIPIEAALIARNIAPSIRRTFFGFMRWRNFDAGLWKKCRKEAWDLAKPLTVPIHGADKLARNIPIATNNAKRAGLSSQIQFQQADFLLDAPVASFEKGIIIMNPPYGERLSQQNIQGFYKDIGDRLKNQYKGYEAWIISGDQTAIKHIGLRASKKATLFNGPLECKYRKYELF